MGNAYFNFTLVLLFLAFPLTWYVLKLKSKQTPFLQNTNQWACPCYLALGQFETTVYFLWVTSFFFFFFAVPGEKKKKRQHICHIIGCGKVKTLIAVHSYYHVKTRRNYSYVKVELLHVCKKKFLKTGAVLTWEKYTHWAKHNNKFAVMLVILWLSSSLLSLSQSKNSFQFHLVTLLRITWIWVFTSMYVATVVLLFQVTFLRVTIISITIISIINLLTFWPAFSIHTTPP